MKCDECGTNDATIHLTQIAQSETIVSHLCEGCARKRGISVSIGADGILMSPETDKQAQPDVLCPTCRLPLSEFRSKGRLGCSQCYGAFEGEIDELLLQVHGAKVHRGKSYSLIGDPSLGLLGIEQLRAQLVRAVKNEEFELAASLRDAINGLAVRNAEMTTGAEGN